MHPGQLHGGVPPADGGSDPAAITFGTIDIGMARTASEMPAAVALDGILEAYDGFLIDAYGVLVDKQGALPGAAELLARLDRMACPWLVVTNSASRLPEALSAEFAEFGLPIPPDRLLTAGSMLSLYFAEQGLGGSRCVVLGPADAGRYAKRAGAEIVALAPDADAEVLVVADQKGVRWPLDMDLAVSLLIRRLDAGESIHALLCNPDLVYPVAAGRFGFTAGGLAAMLEAVLRERYPERSQGFVRLGKPYRPIFDAAQRRLGGGRMVMLGDQLATDILGAARAGIDSVLVGTGLAPKSEPRTWAAHPTWYLPSLRL